MVVWHMRQRPAWNHHSCLLLALTFDIEMTSDLVSLGLKFLLSVTGTVNNCQAPLRML